MASSTSSGSMSSLVQRSGSEEDLKAVMDQRKRKRMISNRESARRSRMRKQKHLDDLTAQVSHLTKENHHVVTRLSVTAQHLMGVEAENCVLRAQVGELTHRLESLDEIINFLNANSGFNGFGPEIGPEPIDGMLMNHMNYLNHPIMASVDGAFQC